MKSKQRMSHVELLQIEKQRLKQICALQEQKLTGHLEQFRNHSFRMAINSILPFEAGTKSKVVFALQVLNDKVLPLLFGVSFGRGRGGLLKNVAKLGQALLISSSFKFFQKIFRRKKPEAEIGID